MNTTPNPDDLPKKSDPGFAALIPPDPLMQGPWHGSVLYALSQPDALAAFTAETGVAVPRSRTPLDALIDDATGRHRAFVLAFLKWHNDAIWGDVRLDHTGAVAG